MQMKRQFVMVINYRINDIRQSLNDKISISRYHCFIKIKNNTGTCPKKQFLCSNGNCIPFIFTCNGLDECGDRSDENITTCLSGNPPIIYFSQPSNIKCLNFKISCFNNLNPFLLSGAPCMFNQFLCVNGNCISITKVNNGIDDCGDTSDEKSGIFDLGNKNWITNLSIVQKLIKIYEIYFYHKT